MDFFSILLSFFGRRERFEEMVWIELKACCASIHMQRGLAPGPV